MPRFAANISLLYPELPLLERIGAAARDGFAAVEVQQPAGAAAADFARALREARCRVVLMNAPAGDPARGERGLAALPGRESDFDRAIEQGLDYARTIGAPRVHVMAGCPPAEADAAAVRATYVGNLRRACARLGAHGIGVTIEPINPRDAPGYWLTRPELAEAVIAEVGAANLGLQFDAYHVQIVAGDLLVRLRRHAPHIAHVQIAGVPERHEPDTGELDYPAFFAALDALGYRGWVGCEYRPARGGPGGTSAGLGWLRRV